MIDMEFLLAIDKLPEVGVRVLRRRDGVLSLLSSAEDLRRRADLIEDQALQAQNALKARVGKLWTDKEMVGILRGQRSETSERPAATEQRE
ncbi:hypothetical protein CSC67_07760 [Pusillimonas caeni]|uniref:stable inheritance protein KleA n=1 Tax=Pusillimonas caeni TaxID=1348472 RepID=UPI000E59EF16|nr:stable inheritance protein KleA [Pusillimonas caeni]TFL14056.1 hypothetical protein CSC67_07760 [Pusillimonas caeni]